MTDPVLNIKVIIDSKSLPIPYTPSLTTAEDVCITLCKHLGIGNVARHAFALREPGKHIYLMPSHTFEAKAPAYELRFRFKAAQVLRLKKTDVKAYDYYFHQARNDVLENKIPDLPFEKYRRELVGLGVTDMYRVMLEKDIPRETVESDYKKYIPKEVLKRHAFFIKKPIHDTLGKIRKSGHDAWYVKEEYLKQLEMMTPEYPVEEYKALMDQNGSICNIFIKVTPFHPSEPGIKYCLESKREKWNQICTIDELGFISIRKDSTVELSRRNGIPFYLKFSSLPSMYSFVSLLDGYYRLTSKWTFNICKDVPTPSLQRLYAMKCHGPVGGEFSYAKLEEKRSNRPGCFILREDESKYNIYYIDVCMKDSLKPKTYKLERLSGDEFIFNDDLTRYNHLAQLMASYNDPNGPIYLAECLPPSEYDKSPLLLCKRSNLSGDALTDGTEEVGIPTSPICINTKDLQVYKGASCLKWVRKRKKVKVNDTFVKTDKYKDGRFPDGNPSAAKRFCRNPDGDVAGPWCFVEVEFTTEVLKNYCDVPFCDGQDCNLFSRELPIYSHYIGFPGRLSNFSFGVKLWNPDSYLETNAKLVLSLLPLPLSGTEIDALGIGIEISLSNSKSAMTIGNKDKPEFEATHGILKSTEYTYFDISWDHGFLTLNKLDKTKPVFLQEFKTKGNLMGHKRDQFHYYSVQGTNVLWSFPFCEDQGDCDVHTTGSSKEQVFQILNEKDVGHDLTFYVRAVHSATILLVPTPVLSYPFLKITLGTRSDVTNVVYSESKDSPTVTLSEKKSPGLISYWKWSSFSITFFSDLLQIFWTRDIGTFMIVEVKHEIVKSLRWFSPASVNGLAHWTFYCEPPKSSNPPEAFLPECALNAREVSYIGTQDVTNEGLPCLPWSGKKLIPGAVYDQFKANPKDLLEMYNYCRVLSFDDTNGTYCYAVSERTDKRVEKSHCKIRKCKSAECKVSGTGNDYIGKVSVTRSNRTCQHWVANFSIDSIQTANVNKPVGLKFNVTDGTNKGNDNLDEFSLELCNKTRRFKSSAKIDFDCMLVNPEVPVVSNVSNSIKDYLANTACSHAHKLIKVHDVDSSYLNETLYADMTAERAENYCRNPSRVFGGQKREGSEGLTVVYRCMWRHTKGKKTEVAMKILNSENRDKYLKEFLELSGHWAFLQSNVIVRLFGVTLTSQLSMVLEYIRFGPLDQYLRDKKADIKVVDLLEASSNLASALWHLAEHGIVHGNIRCRKLLVSNHDENSFTVKLADPGIHTAYASKEVHWIPIECYSNLDFARRSTAADVWAFATTLWEIFMYGENIKHTDHLDAMRFYAGGKRLLQPQTCPVDIYKLLLECWDADPHRRKLPQAIMRDINQMLYQVYNSRKRHAYAKIKNFDSRSMESIYSNQTESTNVTTQEELISVYDMSETDGDLTSKSSLWSVNTFGKPWISQDSANNEDTFSCDFSNILTTVNFSTATTSLDSINSIQSIFELDDDCNVVLQGRIGQGFYGEVYKGTLEHLGDKESEPRLVAVKKLKPSAVSSCLQDFEREILIMKTLKHPNIVEILGVLQEPEVSLVMEFVHHGSLQSYLKIYKESLSKKQLLNYALDIAKGMDYLGKKNIVHRDLAARNILVVDENHVKISDFGLARVIDTNNYYILKTDRELPIKWYALESLRDGKFSTKSDVWSYGVTMFEMFSHGEEPNLPIEVTKMEGQILLDALEKGIRFPCPLNCPQSVYVRLIYPCWLSDPHARPSFLQLGSEIEELLTQY